MFIRDALKNNKVTGVLYKGLKQFRDNKRKRKKYRYHGSFQDRSKGADKLVIILAGYKPFLYDSVFGRIIQFVPKDYDVCVVSSGLYSEKLDCICKGNNWSYLSTKENNVGLVQNVAVSLHKHAKYIFKLDEDIFVTKGFFDTLYQALIRTKKSDYNPGFIAPLININGFTYRVILDEYGLVKEYENRFEKSIIAAGQDRMIQNSSEVAKFMWGDGGVVPHIDELNDHFMKKDKKVIPCPIRFSIGAILFERSMFKKFGGYSVNLTYNSLGKDEEELCSYCLLQSRPAMICCNSVVGHFSFGSQTEEMKDYYNNNPDSFKIGSEICN